MGRPKRITQQQITGPLGVNFVEGVLLRMGFPWHPTRQELEGGIDGFIEIRDPATGTLTNSVLKVQVKTTSRKWTSESSQEFSLRCESRDIDYWMSGDPLPLVLIAVRPEGDEAYWANVRQVFADPERRKDQYIRFDKKTQRFDTSAARALMTLAVPKDAGLHMPSLAQSETLISNLLTVKSFPPTIYEASTPYRTARQVIDWAKAHEVYLPGGWILTDAIIRSFHDLRQGSFQKLCDVSTTELFDSRERASDPDLHRQREFVRLMNDAFRGDMRIRRLWRSKNEDCFYFPPVRGEADQPEPRVYTEQTGRECSYGMRASLAFFLATLEG